MSSNNPFGTGNLNPVNSIPAGFNNSRSFINSYQPSFVFAPHLQQPGEYHVHLYDHNGVIPPPMFFSAPRLAGSGANGTVPWNQGNPQQCFPNFSRPILPPGSVPAATVMQSTPINSHPTFTHAPSHPPNYNGAGNGIVGLASPQGIHSPQSPGTQSDVDEEENENLIFARGGQVIRSPPIVSAYTRSQCQGQH